MRPKGGMPPCRRMSPIEQHLAGRLERALADRGIGGAAVTVLAAAADDWAYRIRTGGRGFEFGFSPRDPLWCREITAGREKHLVSNDQPPACDSDQAWALALQLITRAVSDPAFPPRDPPVI